MNVASIMSSKVVTVSANTSIRDAWKLLFPKNMNAVPVVDGTKKLIGILAKDDLLKALDLLPFNPH